MKKTLVRVAAAVVILAGSHGFASASENQIIGTWVGTFGPLQVVSACGAKFCVKAGSGEDNGESTGKFTPNEDGTYAAELTDWESGDTFTATATITGDKLVLNDGEEETIWMRH